MTDEAVVWKLGFGALVLVFCGLTVALRKPAPPVAPPAARPVVAAPAPVTQPPPADIQDESPPRIEVVIGDPPPQHEAARMRTQWKPLRRATHPVPPRIHRVVAERREYAAGRPHYPFNPRERWSSRELP
jgi:hypothetical protein